MLSYVSLFSITAPLLANLKKNLLPLSPVSTATVSDFGTAYDANQLTGAKGK
jgi:hypothetical protein